MTSILYVQHMYFGSACACAEMEGFGLDVAAFKMEALRMFQNIRSSMNQIIVPVVQSEGLTGLNGEIQNITSICSAIGMGQANASTLCKKLERDGFLLRERSKEDERVVTLRVTEKGVTALQRIHRRFNAADPVLETIPAEKLETVLAGFRETEEIFRLMAAYVETQGRSSVDAGTEEHL